MFGTAAKPRGVDGERLWLGADGWLWLDIRLPLTPRFLVLCPKTAPVNWMWDTGAVPRDVGAVCTACPSDVRGLDVLRSAWNSVRSVVFVGDLDPAAIVQYLEARRSFRRRNGPPLLYGGVDDAWLAAIARRRRPGLQRLRLPLSKAEAVLLKRLEAAVDLEGLLGPDSCSILRGGYKIELEGAINPTIHGSEHVRWVLRHLRAAARQAT